MTITLRYFLAILWSYYSLTVSGNAASPPQVQCETTKGPIVIEVHQELAPIGAKHFLELVEDSFYTDIALYRCVAHFLTQFGISQNSAKKHWHREQIKDDVNLHRGIKKYDVSFAGGGPNTRSTQIFIAFETLNFLGKEPWETPFGKVISGFDVLDQLYKGYGDISPFNKKGPDQQKLFNQGNRYIHDNFPLIDFIQDCRVLDKSTLQGILYSEGAVTIAADVTTLPPPAAPAAAVSDTDQHKIGGSSSVVKTAEAVSESATDKASTVSVVDKQQVIRKEEDGAVVAVPLVRSNNNLRVQVPVDTAATVIIPPVPTSRRSAWVSRWAEEVLIFLEGNITEFLFTDVYTERGAVLKGELNYIRAVGLLLVVVAVGFTVLMLIMRGLGGIISSGGGWYWYSVSHRDNKSK